MPNPDLIKPQTFLQRLAEPAAGLFSKSDVHVKKLKEKLQL